MTNIESEDLPPPLPPPISRAAVRASPNTETKSQRAVTPSGWSVRAVGLAAFGTGVGGLVGPLATWVVMLIVRSTWGIGGWSEWMGWGTVLLPALIFGLVLGGASLVEKPFAIVGIIAAIAIKMMFFKQTTSLDGLLPERPLGGFDLTTMIVFGGVVWGLAGAMAGAWLGAHHVGVRDKSDGVTLTKGEA